MTEAPIHPVTEIQGIGGGLAAQLADRGILFDIDLLQLAPHWQAQMLADVSGLTYDGLIESVLPQAALLRLPGMTGQMAEGITVKIQQVLAWIVAGRTDAEVYAQWRQLVAPDVDLAKSRIASEA